MTFIVVSAGLMTWRRSTCGYSMSWKPDEKRSAPETGDVTTARSVYAPVLICAGARTTNRAERASSSLSNVTGTLAGVAVQPWGKSSATVAVAAAFVSFVTETNTSRSTGFAAGPDAVGNTASAGVTCTENAGTTLSSMRLSPK